MGDLKLLITIVLILTYDQVLSMYVDEETEYSNYDEEETYTSDVAALGRKARIGQLYDARIDEFPGHFLVANVPEKLIETIDITKTQMKYLQKETLQEKLSYLNVEADLRVSVLTGMVNVKGSGKILKDKRHSSSSVKVVVSTIISTVYEKCPFTTDDVKDLIDMDVLWNTEATHVVVGIEWGGKIFAVAEDYNSEGRDHGQVEGRLRANVDTIMSSFNGSGSVDVHSTLRDMVKEYKCEIYGDIQAQNQPRNIYDAIDFMNKSMVSLTKGNGGKGKEMVYHLQPIAEIRRYYNVQPRTKTYLTYIAESTIDRCVMWFEEIMEVEQQVNDLLAAQKQYEKYYSKDKLATIASFSKSFYTYESYVKKTLTNLLVKVRSSEETADKLTDFLSKTDNHELSPHNIDLDQFRYLEKGFKFLKYLIDERVDILDKHTKFATYLSDRRDHFIYVFFYRIEQPVYETSLNIFRDHFQSIRRRGEMAYFVAIKEDVLDDEERETFFDFNGPSKMSRFSNMKCDIPNYEISDIPICTNYFNETSCSD